MDIPGFGMCAVMGFVVFGLCILQTGAFIRIPAGSNIIQANSSDEKDGMLSFILYIFPSVWLVVACRVVVWLS